MKKKRYWLGYDEPSPQDTFFLEALDSNLWEQGSEEEWDTCWQIDMPSASTFENLTDEQSINHIPGNNSLTIKSFLYDTLRDARERLQGTPQSERYNFFPETFLMPEDYFSYQEKAAKNPDDLWIQKPKNLSRGRGIEVVKDPKNIPLGDEWLIQRYLSNPHLYDGRKYVLRCYVLITSVEPLRFYWYQEGFCKLASEQYSMDDLDNLYRHLTNPDINEENTNQETPVTFYSFEQYRQWLRSFGHDDQTLFSQLKELITLTVIAAREKMRLRMQETNCSSSGCYELIGLDCMIDDELKPWVLECNLSPSLATYAVNDDGGDCETATKRAMIKDLVSILGFNSNHTVTSMTAEERLQWEMKNKGNFECLFPASNANDYFNCFPIPRYQDINTLAQGISFEIEKLYLDHTHSQEFAFDDSLALLPSHQQTLITPNDSAAWIWLHFSQGMQPNDIAKKMAALFSYKEALQQVWDVLADWGQAGAFANKAIEDNNSDTTEIYTQHIFSDSCKLTIETSCSLAKQQAEKIESLPNNNFEKEIHIKILRTRYGYLILNNEKIVSENVKLSEIIIILHNFLAEHSLIENDLAYINGAITKNEKGHTLTISTENKTSESPIILTKEPQMARKISSTKNTYFINSIIFSDNSSRNDNHEPSKNINYAEGFSSLWNTIKNNERNASEIVEWINEVEEIKITG